MDVKMCDRCQRVYIPDEKVIYSNEELNELLMNCLDNIKYYADNAPVLSLNEGSINQPKKKLTIYDLNRFIFPFDPIRDWVEKKIKEINEKYAWTERL